jgi:hypothetical protein
MHLMSLSHSAEKSRARHSAYNKISNKKTGENRIAQTACAALGAKVTYIGPVGFVLIDIKLGNPSVAGGGSMLI